MNKKSFLIAAIVIIVLGLAFFLYKFKPAPSTVAKSTDIITEEQQHKMDLETLDSSSATPHQRYGAMIRLAQKQEDVARKEALKRVKDESALLRGGAAQALGYFQDSESETALKSLLSDSDKSVRLFAIQGLGNRMSSLREQDLRALLQNSNLDEETKVEIHSSLMKIAKTPAEKDGSVSSLLKIAESDDQAGTEAALRVISLAPENPRVIELIRRKISEAKNERVMSSGIRYLSSKDDPWIRNNLKRLSGYTSPMVRSAVIQSLHRTCPQDRWDILNTFLEKERDEAVLRLAVQEPLYLLGEPSVQFLKKAISSGSLSDELKKEAQESLKQVQSASSPELCERNNKAS